MDFVHDQLAPGQKIRVLTVVDTFSRFSPVIDPRFSYRGEDVVAALERVGSAQCCRLIGSVIALLGVECAILDHSMLSRRAGTTQAFPRPRLVTRRGAFARGSHTVGTERCWPEKTSRSGWAGCVVRMDPVEIGAEVGFTSFREDGPHATASDLCAPYPQRPILKCSSLITRACPRVR